jgi:hypothetical protein
MLHHSSRTVPSVALQIKQGAEELDVSFSSNELALDGTV